MPLEDAANELTHTIESLKDSIKSGTELRDDLDRLTSRSILNQRLIWAIIVGSVVGIIVTVGLVITVIQVKSNSDQINQVVQTQHDSALCPLYRLFLNVDTSQGNNAARARGDDMAVRAEQFATIRRSYAALKCE